MALRRPNTGGREFIAPLRIESNLIPTAVLDSPSGQLRAEGFITDQCYTDQILSGTPVKF